MVIVMVAAYGKLETKTVPVGPVMLTTGASAFAFRAGANTSRTAIRAKALTTMSVRFILPLLLLRWAFKGQWGCFRGREVSGRHDLTCRKTPSMLSRAHPAPARESIDGVFLQVRS